MRPSSRTTLPLHERSPQTERSRVRELISGLAHLYHLFTAEGYLSAPLLAKIWTKNTCSRAVGPLAEKRAHSVRAYAWKQATESNITSPALASKTEATVTPCCDSHHSSRWPPGRVRPSSWVVATLTFDSLFRELCKSDCAHPSVEYTTGVSIPRGRYATNRYTPPAPESVVVLPKDAKSVPRYRWLARRRPP